MIFDDEISYAQKIESKDFSTILNVGKNLLILTRYWIYKEIDESTVKKYILDRIVAAYGILGESSNKERVNIIYNIAKSMPLLTSKTIYISQEEIDYIKELNDIELEKIVFIFLCAFKMKGEKIHISLNFIKEQTRIHKPIDKIARMVHNIIETKKYFDSRMFRNNDYEIINEQFKNKFNPENIVLAISNKDNKVYKYLHIAGYENIGYCVNCG